MRPGPHRKTEHANLIRFERVLDMRQGRLERSILEETPSGKRVEIRSMRLVSFVHRHLAAVDYEVIGQAEDY